MPLDQVTDFDELIATLDSATGWLEGLGASAGRFRDTRQDIADMQVSRARNEIGRFERAEDFRGGMVALVEALDLCRIHRAFRGVEIPGLASRLQRAVLGPRPGAHEPSEKQARGRNTLAELTWAALLKSKGVEVSLEFRPDAVTAAPWLARGRTGRPALVWEVKRPLGPRGLSKVVQEGARQVRTAVVGRDDLGAFDAQGGCVVVVLDHVITKALPDLDDPEVLRSVMSEALRWWAEQNRDVLITARKDGVAGVVLYWRPLTFLPNSGGVRIPVGCEQLVFFQVRPIIRPPEGPSYVEVARDVVSRLQPWPATS